MTPRVDTLEPRRLMAAVLPTNAEQYLVELINRARANPTAEAARFGIALNEGVPAEDTISTTPKQPLAINPNLTDAARQHSAWMIANDIFSHTGTGGSSPGDRMAAAGYAFNPPWSWGENIAYRGQRPSVPEVNATTARLHQDLFVDLNYPGRGHRVNMLADAFKEVGAGVETGVYNDFNAVIATEDFAYSGTGSILTGVAYTDAVTDDDFYTPGEGIGGVTVTARRASDGATHTAQTWPTGGYSLRLPAGTYEVTGASAALGGTVRFGGVVIGSLNVKRDFVTGAATPAASVVARHAFYNNSAFDGGSVAANALDDAAIATDKRALRPGQRATPSNYTGYSRGINGVMVDVSNLPATPDRNDFTFETSGPGGAWLPAPAPLAVTRRAGAGASGSDRVTLTWADGAVINRWLRVTVKATANTGLPSPDVFYFGNLIGDAGGDAAVARVDAVDLAGIRRHMSARAVPVTNDFDVNRDGRVSAADLLRARSNQSRATLTMITPGS